MGGARIFESDAVRWALLALALLASLPSRAHAYRTLADDPSIAYPARIDAPTSSWSVSVAGLGTQLDSVALHDAARAAAAAWGSTSCGAASIVIDDALATTAAAPHDGVNSIAVVTSDWTGRGFPAGRGATTDLRIERASDGTASIVEADVYLNLADFEFVFGAPSGAQLDVQAVLTHEIGHALGLLHPCEDGGADGAPDCAAHPEAMASALYPTYEGEQGRTLGSDDVAGVCALYSPRASACSPACAANETCTAGRCVATAPFGTCDTTTDCGVGVCGVYGVALDMCVGAGAEGAPCAMGADCATGLCLTSRLAGATYCTHACLTDDDCASIDHCSVAEGRSVCSPRPASGGCTVAPGRAESSALAWAICAVLGAVITSRRRIRRSTWRDR